MGKVDVTEEGFACLPWTSTVNRYYQHDSVFADGSVAAAGSFCRNPRGSGGGVSGSRPWCYVVVKMGMKLNWGRCYIPQCGTCTYLWQAKRVHQISISVKYFSYQRKRPSFFHSFCKQFPSVQNSSVNILFNKKRFL